MKVDILGRRWTVKVMDADTFNRNFDGPAAGVTIPQIRQIVINEEDLDTPTIVHELVHAYFDGLCVSAADLTLPQFEEVTCELFATHGVDLLKLAMKLCRALKRSR